MSFKFSILSVLGIDFLRTNPIEDEISAAVINGIMEL